MMRYLVVYDICDPRRLYRVAKILKDYGERVQKSKFEVQVNPQTFKAMFNRIGEVIDPEEDGVKYIPLCEKCRAKIEIIGLGNLVDPDGEFEIL